MSRGRTVSFAHPMDLWLGQACGAASPGDLPSRLRASQTEALNRLLRRAVTHSSF